MALRVQLYEPIDAGSTTYTLSPVEVLVVARRVRVINVGLTVVPKQEKRKQPKRQTTAVRRSPSSDANRQVQAACRGLLNTQGGLQLWCQWIAGDSGRDAHSG